MKLLVKQPNNDIPVYVRHVHVHVCPGIDVFLIHCIYTVVDLGLLCSAAKAPYLARFRVMEVGVHELEDMAVSTTTNEADAQHRHDAMLEASLDAPRWQGCIFKVGDDVRQVGNRSQCYGLRCHQRLFLLEFRTFLRCKSSVFSKTCVRTLVSISTCFRTKSSPPRPE